MSGLSRGKFFNSSILPFQFDNLFQSFQHGHKQCTFRLQKYFPNSPTLTQKFVLSICRVS